MLKKSSTGRSSKCTQKCQIIYSWLLTFFVLWFLRVEFNISLDQWLLGCCFSYTIYSSHLLPVLFCVAIDWIIQHMSINPGITVGSSTFADLVYADDTALLLPSATDATTSLKSFSGHVARVNDTPAKMTLQLHINVSLSRPPGCTWRRPPGRPRNRWLDQLRNDSTRPIGDL